MSVIVVERPKALSLIKDMSRPSKFLTAQKREVQYRIKLQNWWHACQIQLYKWFCRHTRCFCRKHMQEQACMLIFWQNKPVWQKHNMYRLTINKYHRHARSVSLSTLGSENLSLLDKHEIQKTAMIFPDSHSPETGKAIRDTSLWSVSAGRVTEKIRDRHLEL